MSIAVEREIHGFFFREWYTPRMPELPELEVVIEVLRRRVVDQTIEGVQTIGGGSATLARRALADAAAAGRSDDGRDDRGCYSTW